MGELGGESEEEGRRRDSECVRPPRRREGSRAKVNENELYEALHRLSWFHNKSWGGNGGHFGRGRIVT